MFQRAYHTIIPNQPKVWPVWAKAIASLKIAGEKGVGTTIERLAKNSKLDKLAGIYEQVSKKSCGCKNRQQHFDTAYPYN